VELSTPVALVVFGARNAGAQCAFDAVGGTSGLPRHLVRCTCREVVQDDGVTPIQADRDGGWSLSVLARISIDAPASGDITLVDLPMEFLAESAPAPATLEPVLSGC
jgi:hypothetical protein